MEGKFGHCEPIFYNILFSEDFGTGKYRLRPDPVPIGKLKYISNILYPDNAPEVKYTQNYYSSYCFGSLAYNFATIGYLYAEEAAYSRIE